MRMCGDCHYCYTNETLNGMYICVNGNSEWQTEFVSQLFDEACDAFVGDAEDYEKDGEEVDE